jgi:enoyl-CoA hydratase/carnithine racemase
MIGPMTSPPTIKTRTEGAVALVGFNRPEKRNAITRDVLRDLVDAVTAAERERAVRAIVLYGEGRVFSAGVDFTMLAGDVAGADRTPFRAQVGEMQAAVTRLEAVEKPVIAAMHRYVPGLALEIALACDFRIASDDCELGLPEVKVGLVPDVGGTTRLVRTIGYARAKELILTGRMIPASEALQMGLVTELAPVGTHLEAAIRLAEEIAQNAPLAVGLAKRLIDLGASTDKHTFQAMELLAQSILVPTDDAREGARALAERRPPRFSGR